MALSNLALFVVALSEARDAGETAARDDFDTHPSEAAENWIRSHDDEWFERWNVNQFDVFRTTFRMGWTGAFVETIAANDARKTSRVA